MDLCGARTLRLSSPNSKTLHLVRHAQGLHNVALEENKEKPESEKLFDADLSPKGFQQVSECHKQIRQSGVLSNTELVITSPLLRAMKTSTGIFRGHENMNQYDGFLKANNICAPILAFELCRERMGRYPCDRRERISARQASFSEIDFTLIENDEDTLWQAEEREELAKVAERGVDFLKWVCKRPEKEIAIVSHGIFLQEMLRVLHHKFGKPLQDTQLSRFANCEVRSIPIEKSEMEADTLTTLNCRSYATPSPSTSIHTLE